ncbi:uncharacterized protein [Littorina saxatilis]|uniref:Extradiol ring-cleavage dioxygenase class III enzyme subunit B domain-containing protein n=1 Tax=Littorina saxatilis TaxID=31220 RepID=A0AAN9BVQ4_9CAEN
MTEVAKQPVVFLSHGGGPSFFMSYKDSGGAKSFLKGMDRDSSAAHYLKNMATKENMQSCKAILVISAHWEEKTVTVQTTPQPDLYYDYYGFPPETYKLNWPAKGAPELAQKTRALLEAKGIKCATDGERGYDHGVFVPLLLVFPKPKVPVFQLSLDASLLPEKHLALGEALAPLREEGVLIIGSGFTTHRMGGPAPPEYGKKFQDWLHDVLKNPDMTSEQRRERLASCHRDQRVKDAHPRIEHFLPFLVVMAAAGYSSGKVLFSGAVIKGEALLEHYMFDA